MLLPGAPLDTVLPPLPLPFASIMSVLKMRDRASCCVVGCRYDACCWRLHCRNRSDDTINLLAAPAHCRLVSFRVSAPLRGIQLREATKAQWWSRLSQRWLQNGSLAQFPAESLQERHPVPAVAQAAPPALQPLAQPVSLQRLAPPPLARPSRVRLGPRHPTCFPVRVTRARWVR